MNSLFNYELDERQIRLTLHDAELGCNESSWNEFDAVHPGHINTSAKLSQFNLPKVSLNINRSVLVPLFFIIALGGVSAIMFRFIDFKANKPVEVEKALIPDAANFKADKTDPAPSPEPKTKAAAVIPEAKKDTILAVVNMPPPAATVAVQPGLQNAGRMPVNTPASRPSVAMQKPPVTDSAVSTSPVSEKAAGDTVSAASGQTVVNPESSVSSNKAANTYYYYKGKKRRKKVTADQIESLKAPTTLIGAQTAEAEAEPELRLK